MLFLVYNGPRESEPLIQAQETAKQMIASEASFGIV